LPKSIIVVDWHDWGISLFQLSIILTHIMATHKSTKRTIIDININFSVNL